MRPSSTPADASLQQELHQDGRRLTPQRRKVLDLFKHRGSGCHLSAEEVHQQLQQAQLPQLKVIEREDRYLTVWGQLA